MGIFQDFELPSMEMSLEIVNVAFFMGFLIWLLIEFLRPRTDNGDILMGYHRVVGEVKVFSIITVFCTILICISYAGLSVYEYWKHRIISFKSIFLVMNWAVATVIAMFSRNCRTLKERKRWPLVLILRWVVSLIIDLLSVSVYLIAHLKLVELPHLLPEPNPVDFVSLPLLMLLCFNALPISCARNANDLEHSLLLKEYENSSKSASNFTNAGIWSKLTFRWLNPLFKRGRTEKLKLPHIPFIPQSETAEDASSLLEESLPKQITEASSLPKVLLYAIRKSLAVNALFAGINTIASYTGPLLITNFVNFLSEKNDDSSYYHGLILAFIFFIAKAVESLTQRRWYFGARRIGIRAITRIWATNECKNSSMEMKWKKVRRYIVFRIDEKSKLVIVDKVSGRGEGYDDLEALLSDDDYQYAVFDFDFVTVDNGQKRMIFFIALFVTFCFLSIFIIHWSFTIFT